MILSETANKIVEKGILAADESFPTIEKRFESIGVESNHQNRMAYRKMLASAPGLGMYVSGMILFEETLTPEFVQILKDQAIIPGIKVDKGAKPLYLRSKEKVTEGLDGLRERLEMYREIGAKFAKWRAVLTWDATDECLLANAHALARYARLCQEQKLVPIVEPEVVMDHKHGIEATYDGTVNALRATFDLLDRYQVDFTKMILKPNMVVPGKTAESQEGIYTVATATLNVLMDYVPASVAGIAFLSGGQDDKTATEHLNAINKMAKERKAPWRLTFSYGRALQHQALQTWKGDNGNNGAAQQALFHRAMMNFKASFGEYSASLEAV